MRGRQRRVARAAVVATGFESSLEWLKEAWGDAADRFIVRGTPLFWRTAPRQR
jgi:tricarballylate dehydrogenase